MNKARRSGEPLGGCRGERCGLVRPKYGHPSVVPVETGITQPFPLVSGLISSRDVQTGMQQSQEPVCGPRGCAQPPGAASAASGPRIHPASRKVDAGVDVLLSPAEPRSVSLCILGLERINAGACQCLVLQLCPVELSPSWSPVGNSPGLPKSPGAGGAPKHADRDLKELGWATRAAFGRPLGPHKWSAQG